MRKGIALTGDRPTGHLHLGHYSGSIRSRLELQDTHRHFLMVADMQALTDHAKDPISVRNSVYEVTLDNIACGVDPSKTTFFIQSQLSEIALLYQIFLNLVTLGRLSQNPTVKHEMREKGYGTNVPVGFLTYPVSQAADILGFKPDIVPVGSDQLPMVEQANEIVDRFNLYYPSDPPVFKKVKGAIPAARDDASRLPGIDGKAKMSKSLGNAIYLSDPSDIVSKKVMQMYTDPDHIHKEDPGRVQGNVVFTYLSIFDEDKDELDALKSEYENGGLGDVEIKERLIKVLNNFLEPIREKREYISRKPNYVMELLGAGTNTARSVVSETLKDVKKAMQIDYF